MAAGFQVSARLQIWLWLFWGLLVACWPASAFAGIHSAPVIIAGLKVAPVTRFPINNYRMFRTGKDGEAIPIPFQIDELNEWGDYVLDQGPTPNKSEGNGIFDSFDELAFMGDDVGPATRPEKWPNGKPSLLYEIKFDNKEPIAGRPKEGAVYLGVYFRNPPAPVSRKYVIFDPRQGRVTTSRYRYDFDKQNYLVLRDVSMFANDKGNTDPLDRPSIPLIDSSTFFVKADLKYFLTLNANHRSINSRLDAYKAGPVRTIVRVTFYYTILKLNFEVGMYTEVSFFSNSVILPAIIYNPINGKESLNSGSGFYYGFSLIDNPDSYQVDTNMRPFKSSSKGILDYFSNLTQKPKVESKYWLSALGQDRLLYFEIQPSDKMIKDDNIPYLYRRSATAAQMKNIDNDQILPIDKSPVNIALYFDLTKFDKGEHNISFQLFFDNKRDEKELEVYKKLANWLITLNRL